MTNEMSLYLFLIEGGYFEKSTRKRRGTVLGEKGRGYWRKN